MWHELENKLCIGNEVIEKKIQLKYIMGGWMIFFIEVDVREACSLVCLLG